MELTSYFESSMKTEMIIIIIKLNLTVLLNIAITSWDIVWILIKFFFLEVKLIHLFKEEGGGDS